MDVLLVEDDASIAGALLDGLPRYGFDVQHVTTSAEALQAHPGVRLVLLDLGLPDGDGIDVCRMIRAVSDVPIIIITARSDEVERVVGLELGADDYVSKPFGLRELVARMRAVLRRTTVRDEDPLGETSLDSAVPLVNAQPTGVSAIAQDQVIGSLRLDRDGRRVFLEGAEIALTPKEFDLLSLLASRPGAVHTRESLISDVWDVHWFGSTRTLDVHVGALRRKLGIAIEVQTVRGVGFRLEPVR
jgi:two-component system response regulator RegX3